MNKKIYFITGPTAIGKSKFALNLSKEINGEIINADSMQIYKELKVLTARPSSHDNKKIQHHLYGYVNGNERFNVEKWCLDAVNTINILNKKNITPVFVGGTGLYIETLIKGITPIPTIPEKIKEASNKLFEDLGVSDFHELVYKLDPESVRKISKNDSQRLKRVWEVHNYTNIKFSSWQKKENKNFLKSADFKIIIFLPDRKKNYDRVDERVLKMMTNGAIEEVKKQTNDAVIIAIHSGNTSSRYDPFHFSQVGSLMSAFSVGGYPYGLIDRQSRWTPPEPSNISAVTGRLTRKTYAALAMESSLDGDMLTIKVKLKMGYNYKALKLGLYILEDGLIYDQENWTTYYSGNPLKNYDQYLFSRWSSTKFYKN